MTHPQRSIPIVIGTAAASVVSIALYAAGMTIGFLLGLVQDSFPPKQGPRP